MQSELDSHGSDTRYVVCPEQNNIQSVSAACLCLGAYLILNMEWTYQAVLDAFKAYAVHFSISEPNGLNVSNTDCWRALAQAKKLGWLVAPTDDSEPAMDVEEYLHYARRTNGSVHMSLPGKMLFFPAPTALPDGQQWSDRLSEDGCTARHFSADFYADLLQDFGVSVVACLGRSSPASAAALSARGIETVDLRLADDGSSLLRGLDRLLTLERASPGPVALHSGDGFRWPGYLGTLVAALMISRLGFDEGSAGAWLRMVSPWMFR